MADDPTKGLPADLARVLRDQSLIVPQDASVFELIAAWQNAPSNTASAEINPDAPPRTRRTSEED